MPEPKNLLEKLLEGTSAGDQDEDEVGLPANPLVACSSQPNLRGRGASVPAQFGPAKG